VIRSWSLFFWRYLIAINRRFKPWKQRELYKNEKRINEKIIARKVRLIGPDKEALGIVSIQDALHKAREYGLDLVEIAPKANPPVCKIIDYSKLIFEESKKAREAKKKQHSTQLKEVKFRPRTDEHDYNFKVKHIKEFLEKGNKVKVTIQFRGREMAHKELGWELFKRIKEELEECGDFEQDPRMEGRFLIGFVSPKKIQS